MGLAEGLAPGMGIPGMLCMCAGEADGDGWGIGMFICISGDAVGEGDAAGICMPGIFGIDGFGDGEGFAAGVGVGDGIGIPCRCCACAAKTIRGINARILSDLQLCIRLPFPNMTRVALSGGTS